ncbi:aminotransferase-like domain-containing protein [Burkholderia vietnamiensis]|uniref:aminotransferase-like domain-containing protein n=1 Tax=Burkholderia vietnamiensis TaxID=60552 RepID=UPI00075608A1|nr:PLP-dependent aminotransferase family protein [Burkholderia vietnamiensis]KVR91322.1 GntR family transcriptional regulator [Burkholderia vietnamiensis]MCA7982893.1 PLP-dependent aminotransferase family protein [Burkholderia vietnamiensis]HDR8932653.1 PLP-dependent aminotransferase family protein [Burkholderia vietnamiensis]
MEFAIHHWSKRLLESRKPAYLLISDLIEEDLAAGRLKPRDRLPGLRDLAGALNLNYTTVARAYAEARRRGLLDTRAGSGTFVRGPTRTIPLSAGSSIEMSMNMPPEPPEMARRLQQSAAALFDGADPYQLMRYQDFGGTPADRAAGRTWLANRLPGCSGDTVLVCPGIHSALVALVSTLARRGDTICLDSLAYPGIKAIASQLGVQLQPLPRDDDGPLPHGFESLCKSGRPAALYCNPTLQNPSTLTIPFRRREALADVALRYNVPIIEDDAYAMLPQSAPPPLALLAPELTYYVTGMSKNFGAGLRIAYLLAPTVREAQRIAGALRATTVMPSPFTMLLSTQWVNDGTASEMLDAIRSEAHARQAIAGRILGAWPFDAHPDGFHLWLPIPRDCLWTPPDVAQHLRSRSVAAVASAAFSTDGDPPAAIRICLGGPQDREQCRDGLELVADALTDAHHLYGAAM